MFDVEALSDGGGLCVEEKGSSAEIRSGCYLGRYATARAAVTKGTVEEWSGVVVV